MIGVLGLQGDFEAHGKKLEEAGSDAHIVSHIGRCATRFPGEIRSEAALVEALRAGDFEAVTFKQS